MEPTTIWPILRENMVKRTALWAMRDCRILTMETKEDIAARWSAG